MKEVFEILKSFYILKDILFFSLRVYEICIEVKLQLPYKLMFLHKLIFKELLIYLLH
jgi:hypothetical protein